MFYAILECIFAMIMTQVALFDLYTDIAFTALVHKEGISPLWIFSLLSNIAIFIPKIYAMGACLMLMFGCS
jgi:hypothetical protein